jgi:RNA polymerase subunit RPABC4/transcription elongation factor Spt4
LVGPICREEFHNGILLILDTHAADSLSAIHIEYPHGYAHLSCYSWEKTGEWFSSVVIANDEITILIQLVVGFGRRIQSNYLES